MALDSSDAAKGRSPRFDVTGVGETMLRLSVGVGERLSSARCLDVHVAGAESNVCAALAGLGRSCGLVTKLPRNPLGDRVIRSIRAWGVDVDGIVVADEGRVGTYFVELAAPPVPTRVVYDRAGSAFRDLRRDEVDWDLLLDTRILHLTGITPALGAESCALAYEAIDRAQERGVMVSLDVNHRDRLWSPEDAVRTLEPMIGRADVLFCGRKDAVRLFDVGGSAEDVLAAVQDLTRARHVVVSLGADGVIAASDGRTGHHPALPVTVVDRIGAGDALAAGFLDGLLDGDPGAGLARGAALAACALGTHGDVVSVTREELEALAEQGVGDVLR